MQVNRSLKDDAMNQIDHALGRPLDPMAEPRRNNYVIEPDAPLAAVFRASPLWAEGRTFCEMAAFHVTEEGRKALAAHLKEIGDPHRAFDVKFRGHTTTVVSTTHSKARYSYWLDVADYCGGMTFGDFCRRTSVRLAA